MSKQRYYILPRKRAAARTSVTRTRTWTAMRKMCVATRVFELPQMNGLHVFGVFLGHRSIGIPSLCGFQAVVKRALFGIKNVYIIIHKCFRSKSTLGKTCTIKIYKRNTIHVYYCYESWISILFSYAYSVLWFSQSVRKSFYGTDDIRIVRLLQGYYRIMCNDFASGRHVKRRKEKNPIVVAVTQRLDV